MKRRSLLPWYIFHDSGQIWPLFVANDAQRKKEPVDSGLVPENPAEHPTFSTNLCAFGEDVPYY